MQKASCFSCAGGRVGAGEDVGSWLALAASAIRFVRQAHHLPPHRHHRPLCLRNQLDLCVRVRRHTV